MQKVDGVMMASTMYRKLHEQAGSFVGLKTQSNNISCLSVSKISTEETIEFKEAVTLETLVVVRDLGSAAPRWSMYSRYFFTSNLGLVKIQIFYNGKCITVYKGGADTKNEGSGQRFGSDVDLYLQPNALSAWAIQLSPFLSSDSVETEIGVFIDGTIGTSRVKLERTDKSVTTSLGITVTASDDRYGLKFSDGRLVVEPMDIIEIEETWNARRDHERGDASDPNAARDISETDMHIQCENRKINGTLFSSAEGVIESNACVFVLGGSGFYDRFGRAGFQEIGYRAWAEAIARRGGAVLLAERYGDNTTSFMEEVRNVDFEQLVSRAKQWCVELGKNYSKIIL